MLFSNHSFKIHLAPGGTDMRKSIDGLSILVSEVLELDPLSGHLFAFCNRKQNIVKILYWERNGFCLWHKRLEKNSFKWPQSTTEVMDISGQELSWLLDGLSIHQQKAHKSLKYSAVF